MILINSGKDVCHSSSSKIFNLTIFFYIFCKHLKATDMNCNKLTLHARLIPLISSSFKILIIVFPRSSNSLIGLPNLRIFNDVILAKVRYVWVADKLCEISLEGGEVVSKITVKRFTHLKIQGLENLTILNIFWSLIFVYGNL